MEGMKFKGARESEEKEWLVDEQHLSSTLWIRAKIDSRLQGLSL